MTFGIISILYNLEIIKEEWHQANSSFIVYRKSNGVEKVE